MCKSTILLAIVGLVGIVNGHIQLTWPPPLRAPYNPAAAAAGVALDYTGTAPLAADGSNFPFKGYNADLDGPAGASVAIFAAGSAANVTTGSGAPHGGGSCQISLSYDKGASFNVIHSFIGSCPVTMPQTFSFTIPSDAPTGSAVMAWSWHNMIGNREMYLSAASVTITAATGASKRSESIAFKDRPSMFVANLANGCTTTEGAEVVYPDPGPDADVTVKHNVAVDGAGFTGTCAAVKGVGGDSSASSAGSGATSPSASFVAQPSSIPASTASASVAASAAAATSPSFSTTLTVTADGQCSGAHTCATSPHGPCCSQYGWCGSTADYCMTGCQAGFGSCGSSAMNSTSNAALASSDSAAQSAAGIISTVSIIATVTETVAFPTTTSLAVSPFLAAAGASSGFVTSTRAAGA